MTIRSFGFCFALLAFTGCGAPPPADEYSADGHTALLQDAKLDAVSTGAGAKSLYVWLDLDGQVATPNGQRAWTFTGRTNHDLDNVFSFVPDDAFGRAELTGPRTFALILDDHEVNSVLAGLRLLVSFKLTGSTQSYTAGVLLTPRFTGFAGSSKIFIESQLRPVSYAGGLEYRAHATFSVAPVDVNIYTDDDVGPRLLPTGPKAYDFDWNFTNLSTAADPPADPVHVTIVDGKGTAYAKTAHLRFSVSELSVTTRDPYERWPATTCRPSVQACLDGLPFGSYDTAACGAYGDVRVCRLGQVLPDFLPASQSTDEINQLVTAANQSLTGGKQVAVSLYRYDFAASQPPSIDQILAGYARFDRLEHATLAGARPRGELDAQLAAYQLSGLPAAIQRLVFVDSLAVGKVTQPSQTLYVLQVAEAGLIVVVTLTI